MRIGVVHTVMYHVLTAMLLNEFEELGARGAARTSELVELRGALDGQGHPLADLRARLARTMELLGGR